MQDLNDLYYFVQVVDYKGFAPAGRALGIPKSKLSRRIANLEESLGVQLLIRSTRRFSVTEIGQNYYRHCKAMLVEAEAAQEAIEMTRAEPCGVVRLTCPVGLLDSTVGSMLAKYMIQCPRVDVHLEATNRRVDILDEAVDLAIRVRSFPLDSSDWVTRHLGDRRQCLVASSALLNELGEPHHPRDLSQLPSLWLGQPHQEFKWTLESADGARTTVKHEPRFITLDMAALRYAAIAGVGVVQLPLMIVREELKRQLLVEVLPDWTLQAETVHIVFVSHRGLLPAVRSLIDFLVEEFEAINDES